MTDATGTGILPMALPFDLGVPCADLFLQGIVLEANLWNPALSNGLHLVFARR